MANTFITLKLIARQALPRLIENLVFPNLVHRDYSETFKSLGDTVQVRKPTILTAEEFDQTSGVNYQDMVESSVDVKLDTLATVDAAASVIETAVNIDDLNRVFIEPAAVALAEKINADGLKLYADVPYAVGTAGTTPSDLSALANARKQLNINKAPVAGRVAVWDPEADAAFTQIPAIVNAEKSGSTQALREGSIGRVMGFENYMAQGVVHHESAVTTATAVKTSAAVAEGDAALNLSGTALTGKLSRGDILTIKGAAYVVTEDSAAAASNAIDGVKVYPALPALSSDERPERRRVELVVLRDRARLAAAANGSGFGPRPGKKRSPCRKAFATGATEWEGVLLPASVGLSGDHRCAKPS